MGDANKCFDYLQENVPLWTTGLKEVAEKIEKRRIENEASSALAANQREKDDGDGGNDGDDGDNSMETWWPAEENTKDTDILLSGSTPISAKPCQVEIPSPVHIPMISSPPILCKRKRDPSTLTSGHVARMARYRTKPSAIVTYDSEIQESFDGLVKSIGGGRNMIRKAIKAARMAAAAAAVAADAANGEDNDEDDEEEGFRNARLVLAQLGYRANPDITQVRRARMMSRYGNNRNNTTDTANVSHAPNGNENFDLLDKTLEKAQNQCERGAHQLLRDGECTEEIDSVLVWFREILAICEKESKKVSTECEKADPKVTNNGFFNQPAEEANTVSRTESNSTVVNTESDDEGGEKNSVNVRIEEQSFEPPSTCVDIKLDADDHPNEHDAHINSNTLVSAV